MRHEAGNDPDAYADAIDRWTTYCERLGIGGIAVGAVILRRRAGDNWVRADQLPAERLVLDGHARLEQRVVYGDGAWNVEEIGVALEDGLGFTAKLDSATAGMPAALDRTRTLGDVGGDLAPLEG